MRSNSMTRALTAVLAAFLLPLFIVPTALAGGDDPPSCPDGTVPSQPPGGSGWICIPAVDPGNGGGNGGEEPGNGGTTPGSTACYDENGKKIPCTSEYGTWNSARQCYAKPLVPQPNADQTEYWKGNDPATGSIWVCSGAGVAIPANTWFVPGGEAPPDPGEMAETIVKAMPLVKPTVHMAPQPPLMTYVGLETWLWMGENQWRNVTGSASIGDTTVSVVAEPIRVTWDLGDGIETCTSAGRKWEKGMSSEEQTDCSYVFQHVSDFQPNGVFPVTATISYAVSWTCSGTCIAGAGALGEIPGFTSDVSTIRVGERQSVVVR